MKKTAKKGVKKKTLKWPFWIIGSGILVIVIALLLLGRVGNDTVTPKVTGSPAIEVDQKIIDYGAVKLGTVINTSIRVTNVGDQTLRFSQKPYVELIEGC